jgi:transcriptional regulator of arginine metabolism
MNQGRQQAILEIISDKRIANQQELVDELEQIGIATTQSSVSRDIARLGLIKLNGHYAAPRPEAFPAGPILSVDTAGDCIVVIKTEIGQASPTALKIDQAAFAEIVGTVAGDDTMLIAVKNAAAQRIAIKKIMELFSTPEPIARAVRGPVAPVDATAGRVHAEGIGNNV